MLTYTTTGPHQPDGRFLVVYPTPGSEPICVRWSERQAQDEAQRLNDEQAGRAGQREVA
jgi:hypothetical protein